jgi:hypothetical protein
MTLVVRSQLGLIERLTGTIDDCGPASVAAACSALGVPTTTKQGWQACKDVGRVDTDQKAEGTSAREVILAVRRLGLRAKPAYAWKDASDAVKAGAALILNIQAGPWMPEEMRSDWQRRDWKRRPTNSYGHWVTLTYEDGSWRYVCPTMTEGKPAKVITSEQVRMLRDSKAKAGFSSPPAMVVVSARGA